MYYLYEKERKSMDIDLEYLCRITGTLSGILLKNTDRSSSDIGEYLAFSSPGHFSRVFKKYTGKAPKAYRSGAN